MPRLPPLMKHFVPPSRRGPLARGLAALMMALLLVTSYAHAQQRNPLQTIGHTVLDEPAISYRFEHFVVDSPDQQRRWRVNLAIPVKPGKAPSPVLYALDGNAVAMVLDQPLLAELAARKAPPVLVLIGYDNDLRIDSKARTRDTAWIDRADDEGGTTQAVGGGAAAFLDVIERRIKPEVERRARIDTQQQALWGTRWAGCSCSMRCTRVPPPSSRIWRPAPRCGGARVRRWVIRNSSSCRTCTASRPACG